MFNWQKHKIIMVRILKDIYQDILISPFLGFKGGTACHLFYELNRHSVDLDFDLLKPELKKTVFQEIEKIVKKYTIIKERHIKKDTIFFLLSYGEKEHNIKIEISTRNFGNNYQLSNYLGISLLVMKKEDMFANKLIALLTRKKIANRDIFDLYYFFSQNWDINEEIIKSRMNCGLKECLKGCLRAVQKVNNKQILQGLGELIDEKQKKWVKENLKKELIFYLEFYLKNYKERTS